MLSGSDFVDMLDSWLLHLRGQRRSPATVKIYGDGVRAFLRWCQKSDRPPVLDRATVNAFVTYLLDAGAEAATARSRQLSLRRFSAWLEEEGEIDDDQLATLKPPKLDAKITPCLTDDQIRALIKACATKDFRGRRDEALIRLMVETGLRADEAVSLTMADLDLARMLAVVRRGKGGKARVAPFGPQTAQALDRYLRARRRHRLAGEKTLWLGDRGRTFTYYALYDTLKLRGKQAGIADFHPHVLRHTMASRWLAARGSEGGLMAVAGWTRRDMIDRYTRATASERAMVEARTLGLGDL